MKWLLITVLFLSGCASVVENGKSTDTFAACKAADVATTAIGISSGAFPEGNPLMAKVLSHGYMPFALLSFAMWYVIDRVNNPALTLGANAITCPIVARNIFLLVR